MFIRWQSRKRRFPAFGRYGKSIATDLYPPGFARAREGTNKQDVHWAAILVESVRIDGKPRQKHIARLCGFTDSAVEIPSQQCFLWQHIEERLRQLGDRISPADLKRIKAALIERIGKPPTKAQRAEVERKRKAWLEGGKAIFAAMRI
jgi:hypothetical protein